MWADADVAAAATQMRAVFENQKAAREKAVRARQDIKAKYAMETFRATLAVRIEAIRKMRRQHAA
jgi:hypothetical protein